MGVSVESSKGEFRGNLREMGPLLRTAEVLELMSVDSNFEPNEWDLQNMEVVSAWLLPPEKSGLDFAYYQQMVSKVAEQRDIELLECVEQFGKASEVVRRAVQGDKLDNELLRETFPVLDDIHEFTKWDYGLREPGDGIGYFFEGPGGRSYHAVD